MELDPFTKKLLERTKARRENLDKKEASAFSSNQRKRRSPMSERINVESDDEEPVLAIQKSKEDSPKRQCNNAKKYELSSDKENTCATIIQDEKENNEVSDISMSQQFQNQGLKRKTSNNEPVLAIQNCKEDSPKRQCNTTNKYGLSSDKENTCAIIQDEKENNKVSDTSMSQQFQGLKRKNSNNDGLKLTFSKQKTCSDDKSVEDAAFSSQARLGCKKRLAALAQQINQWENEASQFPPESFTRKISNQPVKTSSNVANTFFNQINAASLKDGIIISNTNTKDTADKLHAAASSNHFSLSNSNQKDNTPIHSTLDGREIGVPTSATVCSETKASPKKAFSKHQQQESQGFTKSPSASKLQYEYSVKSKITEKQKLDSIQEDTSSVVNNNSLPAPKKIKTVTFQEPVETTKELSDIRSQQVDPAELPLSARRELFEKAFSNGNVRNSSDKFENLTVAEKKAMFEKASSGSGKATNSTKHCSVLIEPKIKTEAHVHQSEKSSRVENKQMPSFSTASNTSSPSRTTVYSSPNKLGDRARLLQQQLFKDNNERWQNNEINTKNKLERKQEMAALLNRWEHASSAQTPTALKVVDDPEEPSDQSVINIDLPNNDDNEVESEIETYESNSDAENEPCRKESESEEDSVSLEESNITEQAVAVCDEIDELLDDVLENEANSSSDSVTTSSPVKPLSNFIDNLQGMLQKCLKVYQHKIKPEMSASYQKHNEPCAKQQTSHLVTSINPVTIVEGNKEVPLLHTVSVYRRQKQELQLTPVKKIVRREQIQSPPSPDDDTKLAVLQKKLQGIQEEVLAQQTVISQASQALNLCHATTEFAGSTEQVEAERLLLISTQKHQAYLNEIQRLKTDGVLGNDGECGAGTLTLSDISLGLKREFLTAKLEGKSDNHVHYFICLVRSGAQLIATQMLSTEDEISGNCLNYTNHITIQELRSDFSVSFEVYALAARKEIIPHNKKYHIKKDSSKLRLTPKAKKPDSRLISPAITSPGGPYAVRTPNFRLVGFTRLTLRNVNRSSYILEKVPYISPLEGTLSIKVQLHAKHDITERGFLTMFEDVSGFGAWHRRWCILQGNYLAYWKYPEDDKKKDPIGTIDLRQCATACVKLVSRDICARPHTFQLVTIREQKKDDKDSLISQCKDTLITTKHLLSADTKEERILWCNRLNDVLSSIRKWDPHAVKPMA